MSTFEVSCCEITTRTTIRERWLVVVSICFGTSTLMLFSSRRIMFLKSCRVHVPQSVFLFWVILAVYCFPFIWLLSILGILLRSVVLSVEGVPSFSAVLVIIRFSFSFSCEKTRKLLLLYGSMHSSSTSGVCIVSDVGATYMVSCVRKLRDFLRSRCWVSSLSSVLECLNQMYSK